jgi:SAM-dependent methyltransferase
MPSLTENICNWSTAEVWSTSGEEWSQWWGGTPALWAGALWPRIHAMLPTGSILEIAPGHGRFTQYLKDLCERLAIVDLMPSCIERCRRRFAGERHITYHVGDGRSLPMVPDRSVDFVFSFDSLVHADPEVIGGYLQELAAKLKPDGIGFIHHSNAGALKLASAASRRIPRRYFDPLVRRGIAVHLGAWRDGEMTAGLFRRQCASVGLACVAQELVSWEHGAYLLDCFSVFTPCGSRWQRPLRVVRNPLFAAEGRRMARLYAGSSFA